MKKKLLFIALLLVGMTAVCAAKKEKGKGTLCGGWRYSLFCSSVLRSSSFPAHGCFWCSQFSFRTAVLLAGG